MTIIMTPGILGENFLTEKSKSNDPILYTFKTEHSSKTQAEIVRYTPIHSYTFELLYMG